jgi:hypothetical protein
MTKRLQGWIAMGVVAWTIVSNPPAQADAARGAAIWSCENGGSE